MLPVYSSGVNNYDAARPFAGLDLNSTIFNIGSPTDGASENTFTGMRNGVIARTSEVKVYYAKFTKMYNSLGINESPNFNSPQGQAIFGRSSLLTVHHCTFGGEGSNGWRAISTTRANLNAKRNDIYDLSSGIHCVPGGATELLIDDNDFRVTLPNFGLPQAAYVISGAAPGTNIKIQNNNPIDIRGGGPGIWLANNFNPSGTAAVRRVAEWLLAHDTLQNGSLAQVSGILTQNNSISPSNTWVINRKTVNRIYLETLALGIDTATVQQKNDLLAVANQCLLEGGDAVLQARAMYNGFAAEPLVIDDSDICTLGNPRQQSTKPLERVSYQTTLIPNPARDAFTLTVKGINLGEMLRLQVLNANGIVEKDLRLANGSIVSAAFKPGLYICRVYVGEEPADVVKLVVIP